MSTVVLDFDATDEPIYSNCIACTWGRFAYMMGLLSLAKSAQNLHTTCQPAATDPSR